MVHLSKEEWQEAVYGKVLEKPMSMFKHTPPGNVAAMTDDDLDKLMTTAIAEAVKGTKDVCSREHIKGVTRHERVNEFVTQLRRSIGRHIPHTTAGKLLVEKLCRKDAWYDAGQFSSVPYLHVMLTSTHAGSSVLFTKAVDAERVRGWCYMATGAFRPDQELAAEIDQDIERLALDLKALGMQNQEMDRINKRAEEVSDELVKIMEPLAE